MPTRSQAHLTRTGRPQSGGWVPAPPPPITGATPDTASIAGAGAVDRVVYTVAAEGGTSPYTYALADDAGLGIALVGAAVKTTVDPIGAPGDYTVDILCTDARSQTYAHSTLLTVA